MLILLPFMGVNDSAKSKSCEHLFDISLSWGASLHVDYRNLHLVDKGLLAASDKPDGSYAGKERREDGCQPPV